MPNKMTAEDFKTKLMAVVLEFSFKDYDGNVDLGRLVYNAVDSAFKQYDKLVAETTAPPVVNGNGAAQEEEKPKKQRFRPVDLDSIITQIRVNLEDMNALVERHRKKTKSGKLSTHIDWDAAAEDAHVHYGITRADGKMPTG